MQHIEHNRFARKFRFDVTQDSWHTYLSTINVLTISVEYNSNFHAAMLKCVTVNILIGFFHGIR